MATMTAIQDPVNFTVKHALQRKWTLWYDDPAGLKANPSITWEENLKSISSFDTIEDFWGVMNSLKKPTDLPMATNYHLFKTGIKPMWEEAENRNGGKWTFVLEKKRRADLDNGWLNSVKDYI